MPREHFPFFQTAPDGWKNTIRHNLCFSSSFRKTPYQLCREGKRKSCLWHLTLDGQHRLRDEIHTLTGESFQELKGSMSHPGEGSNQVNANHPNLCISLWQNSLFCLMKKEKKIQFAIPNL